jgi:Mce-associated membrane protein
MTTDVHADTQPTDGPPQEPSVTPPPTTPRRKPGTAGPRAASTATTATRRPPRAASTTATPAGTTTAVTDTTGSTDSTGTTAVPPVRVRRDPAGATGADRRRRLPWLIAAVAVVVAVICAIGWASAGGGSAGSADDSAAETAAVRRAATSFSEVLTNFDGATIDRDFDKLIALSTGDFQDQADQFFSTKTRHALKEAQASSRGEVRNAFVQSLSGSRASVFVVVDQTIANNKSPEPQADTVRMELALRSTSEGWRVARVNVLQAPAGAATSSSGSSSGGD